MADTETLAERLERLQGELDAAHIDVTKNEMRDLFGVWSAQEKYAKALEEAHRSGLLVPLTPEEAAALERMREGWVLVPAEATDEMVVAMLAEETGFVGAMYDAALAAAPKPGEPT